MLIIPEGISFRFEAVVVDEEDIPLDLTGYQTAVIKVRRPSPAAALTLTGIVANPAYGEVHGVATAAQMVGVGDWTYFADVRWASGRVVKTNATAFRVVPEGTAVTVCQ